MGKRLSRRAVLGVAASGMVGGCSTGREGDTGSTTQPESSIDRPTPTTSRPTLKPLDATIEAPASSRRDEQIPVRITGLDPGQTVSLTASVEDGGGIADTWISEATFEAIGEGVVDLTEHEPLSGSYEGVDPMGWLWSMAPEGMDGRFVTDRSGFDVTLRARVGERETVRTITRRNTTEDVSVRTVETDDLVGAYVSPGGSGPRPGVLALHGSDGVPPFVRAALLAAHGYAVFAPIYFGDYAAVPDTLNEIPLSYFERAAAWLGEQDGVADGDLGVLGVSRGGELALVLGARYDWVGAVVSYVGSGVRWAGRNTEQATWSVDGEPLASLSYDSSDSTETDAGYRRGRPAFVAAYESADESTLEAATIPVEQIEAPVLCLSGRDDQLWPSTMLSAHAVDRLRASDFDHDFDHLAYEDAGHLITAPYRPTTELRHDKGLLLGGTAPGYAHAAEDAWPTVLDYLATGLDA